MDLREWQAEFARAEWIDRHAPWTADNLEMHGVLTLAARGIMFIHKDHPVISHLREKFETAGQSIDDVPLIENTYFKLTAAFFTTCCEAIREQMYSKPYPLRPRAVRKLQRWACLAVQRRRNARRLALAMALHSRLGAASELQTLDGDLMRLVCSFSEPAAYLSAIGAEGVKSSPT